MKTLNKVSKIVRITGFVSSLVASIVAFGLGQNGEGIAWGCCTLWIANLMMTERLLAVTKEYLEVLKEENNK